MDNLEVTDYCRRSIVSRLFSKARAIAYLVNNPLNLKGKIRLLF
jgi:hypothetical protein